MTNEGTLTTAVAITIIQVGAAAREKERSANEKAEAIAKSKGGEEAVSLAIQASLDKGVAEGMIRTLQMLQQNLNGAI